MNNQNQPAPPRRDRDAAVDREAVIAALDAWLVERMEPLRGEAMFLRERGEIIDILVELRSGELREKLLAAAAGQGASVAVLQQRLDRCHENMKRLERTHGLLVLKVAKASDRLVADCTAVADALLADPRIAYLNFAPCHTDDGEFDGDVLFSLYGIEDRSIDLWLSSDPGEPPVNFVRDPGTRPLALTEHHDPVSKIGEHLDWLFSAAVARPSGGGAS